MEYWKAISIHWMLAMNATRCKILAPKFINTAPKKVIGFSLKNAAHNKLKICNASLVELRNHLKMLIAIIEAIFSPEKLGVLFCWLLN